MQWINLEIKEIYDKRTYKYTSPQLFINKPYDNIENKQFIDRIFDKYCYNQFDRIIIDYKKVGSNKSFSILIRIYLS